jgi:tryptophan synthase alpha chain
MNRINQCLQNKTGILSIYFTAGFPESDSTVPVIRALADAGADMIEIGIPFSDPMADGPVIQQSSDTALKNGMSLKRLFNQLRDIRREVQIPLLLMGYLNPVMQYGVENFCRDCQATGIDGVILPDLPVEIYREEFKSIFESHGLYPVLLITPQTSEERIRMIDRESRGFIYMVSASATTGVKGRFTGEQTTYFQRIQDMKLTNPALIGFGISDHESFAVACRYMQGAIIGSAFVKLLGKGTVDENEIRAFIAGIKKPAVR